MTRQEEKECVVEEKGEAERGGGRGVKREWDEILTPPVLWFLLLLLVVFSSHFFLFLGVRLCEYESSWELIWITQNIRMTREDVRSGTKAL